MAQHALETTARPVDRYASDSVRRLFDDMAATYGYVNLITSFGFAMRWREAVVRGLPLSSAICVVDLMSGMGELWRSLARQLPPSARVIGVDFSEQMTRRAQRVWPFTVDVVVADVFDWTAPASGVDVVVSSFGLKTFNRPQLARLAERVALMLRPGGTCAFIEISMPPSAFLRVPYRFYLRFVIPVLGWLLLGNPDCYRMLGIYTEAFGNSAYFATCLREAGLDVVETSHFYGCATGVRGRKRQDEETR